MPRQVRIQFAGAAYHVMCRGDRREPIFDDDTDRQTFLRTLGECCAKTGWEVSAYVLMGNHYHLLIRTPEPNLVKGMTWFQATYTARYNARHQISGHLFGGRYKAVLVEADRSDYFLTVLDYIHLNPVRAGIVKIPTARGKVREPKLLSFRWSSLTDYAAAPSTRPGWLDTEAGLSACELKDSPKGRRVFVDRLAKRAATEKAEECGLSVIEGQGLQSTLRRGWCYGSSVFKEKMLKAAERLLDKRSARDGANYAGGETKAHHERAAEAIARKALRALGLSRKQLARLPKGAIEKALIARRIRRETTVSAEWVAERLEMGAPSSVSRAVAAAGARLENEPALKRLAAMIDD